MGYYDWPNIMATKTDLELKRIFRDKHREPSDKVDAAVAELQKRGLFDAESESIIAVKKVEIIYDIEKVVETQPNIRRAITAQVMIGIVLVVNIISTYLLILQHNLLISAKSGHIIPYQMAIDNDTRILFLGIISSLANVISGITFILWFYRAYKNQQQRISFSLFSESWAIGCWFVPIISLYKPYQIMKEMWINADRIIETRDIHKDEGKNSKTILNIWWWLWLITLILGTIIFHFSSESNTLIHLEVFTVIGLIKSILMIPLSILTIFIIKIYSAKEALLFSNENGVGIR